MFVVNDPRARLGEVASWVYGDPSRRLSLIGVTGTSGKTTTSYLLESGLRMAGHVTGLIGGVETRIGPELLASELTTPEATDLQALLATMAERGVTGAAMEVSSHALALGRVAGTPYDVAIFTNLSQDHLDFHADLEDYFAAKAGLFTPEYAAAGVVNIDDGHGRRLAASAPIPVTTFSAAGDPDADWRAENVRVGADGSTFRVIGPGGVEADASSPCPARSTSPTRWGRSWRWSRRASAWTTRWPVSAPAPACRAGWSESTAGSTPTSPSWSTTRTSRERSRPCCARCAR